MLDQNPIQQTDTAIVIDKTKVESLSKRFLSAVKEFLKNLITPAKWDLYGLEKTWRYFLPLIIVLACFVFQYAAYLIAWAALIITAVWFWRQAFPKKK